VGDYGCWPFSVTVEYSANERTQLGAPGQIRKNRLILHPVFYWLAISAMLPSRFKGKGGWFALL